MPASGAVTVGTTPVKIGSGSYGRITIKIWNADTTQTLFVGFDGTLTTANGIPILAGDAEEFVLTANSPVLGVVATNTVSARYAELP